MGHDKKLPVDQQSVTRAIGVLGVLADGGQRGVPPGVLLKRVGAPRSSFYRLLKPLIASKLIAQDPTSGCYRLGEGALELGFRARFTSPLVHAAQDILKNISAETRQMSEVVVPIGGDKLVVLDVWLTPNTPTRIMARSGCDLHLGPSNAHGLCYLAFGGREGAYLRRRAKDKDGGLTNLSKLKLKKNCERVRRRGYVRKSQHGPWIRNLRLAVPVYDPHTKAERMLASLAIICDVNEANAHRTAEWASILRIQARLLETKLHAREV